MSTYWNATRGQYENFENKLVELMAGIGDKLEEAAGDNITVVAGIRYDTDEQGLTDEQQGNARANIGAVAISVSGTKLIIE